MRFSELHEHVPLARYGKVKSLSMAPYNNVELLLPGRHAEDTSPKGGDFCVVVDDIDLKWKQHQFTHTDIFKDVQVKFDADKDLTKELMMDYLYVVATDEKPKKKNGYLKDLPGLNAQTFLYAVQCLGVAEHRRYHQHENKYGGRFLPLRYAAGIAEGLWSALDAAEKQRRGRPGVEWLEKDNGIPEVTKKLMGKSP